MSPEPVRAELVENRPSTGSGQDARRRIVIPWSDILITIASIVLAFLVGALLMIVSDTEVRSNSATSLRGPRMR